MATVYLARDLKHGRPVAIKVFHSELAATIGADRFNREIEIAARLQHPHILPVHDSGEADGILFYVMPYVDGESLKELAERGDVPPRDALRFVREVASALDYAHQNGVIHRDIKPANILISQGHAVVADFGIARAVAADDGDGLTQVGMAVGTPWYMSPEQAMADPGVDGRSDVYALAAVLYELLAGHPPYQGSTAQAIIAANVSSPIPDMTELQKTAPETAIAAIRRGLAKDPAERFVTAGEFGAALDLTTGDFGIPKRSRVPAMAAGIVAVAVALGLGWFAGRPDAGTVASGADVIAVLPFDVSGTGEELGEGMVNLLSANLSAVGEIRTVDARTVLQRWRHRGGEDGLDLNGAMAVGRDVRAGSVLLGSVVAAGSGVRLNAEMYNVDGTELARVQVDGDADDVLLLVDSLSLGIIRAIWQSNEPLPSFDVAAITSGSLDAVRAYMRGALFFRHGQFDSAATAFEEAIAVDSTFALAHLQLSETYGWTGNHGDEAQLDAVARAARFTDRLPPRERLLVAGYDLNRRGDLTSIDTLRLYTQRFPSDPRGWSALGDFRYHAAQQLLLAPADLLPPFDEAVALDSSMVAALIHPMELSLLVGDREAFQRYHRLVMESLGSDRGYGLIERAIWAPLDEARLAVDSLSTLNATTLILGIGIALRQEPSRVGIFADVLANHVEQGTMGNLAPYAHAMLAMALGRRRALDRTVNRLASSDDPSEQGTSGFLRVLSVLSDAADTAYARPMLDWVYRMNDVESARITEALVRLAADDAAGARTLIRGVDVDDSRRRVLDGMGGWASLIEGDSARGIEQLRASVDSSITTSFGCEQVADVFRLELARALAANPATREEGIARLRYGFNLFIVAEIYPAILMATAEALEASGDTQGAVAAYSDFVELWSTADQELQPRVDAARRKIEQLTRATN
jgi:serine/threonine-protein kinase